MLKNLAHRVLFQKSLPNLLVARNACTGTVLYPILHCFNITSCHSICFESFKIRCFSTEMRDNNSKKSSSHTSAEESTISDDDVRMKVFDCALNHVAEHGWSSQAISLGAKEAGFAKLDMEKFETNDLLMHFVRESNGKLLCYLQDNADHYKDNKTSLIRDAIEFRLRLIIPYINVWAEAMKMLISPKLFSQSTDELSKMVDDIWCYAGDESSDLEWYIKRGALAQLYGGLQLVMLSDLSDDFKDTWKFLDQR